MSALGVAFVLDAHRDEQWRRGALCTQVDGDVFFPDVGGSTQPAKRICARCPVRVACLEYALTKNLQTGVWGGLSPNQRRLLARQRRQDTAA